MPSKITDFIKKKYGELTTPTVDESSNMETNKVKTDTMRSNSKFNTKLKEKNNVLREYAQIKGLLANMSPEKRQAYSGLVESLYSPMLKPYIKQETLDETLGTQIPQEWQGYGNMPTNTFTQFYPALRGLKKDIREDETLGEYYTRKGMQIPISQKEYKDFPFRDYLRIMIEQEKTVRAFTE